MSETLQIISWAHSLLDQVERPSLVPNNYIISRVYIAMQLRVKKEIDRIVLNPRTYIVH